MIKGKIIKLFLRNLSVIYPDVQGISQNRGVVDDVPW